jgi:ABC-type glutathione transport system ATPase component
MHPPAVLEIQGLVVRYRGSSGVPVVDGISLEVPRGGTLAIVGESGAGKSTIARAVVGLVRVTAGKILLDGRDFTNPGPRDRRELRTRIQLVFQDPHSSLSPRMTIGSAIREALLIHRHLKGREGLAEACQLLEHVGLAPQIVDRFPHQCSGGQLQRAAIARALAVNPDVLILDEVTSSLDVSVQAKVLNLLKSLQRELALSFLYISHDISVVRYMCDEIAVMRHGRIVEQAPATRLFDSPANSYTRTLLDAVPKMTPQWTASRVRLTETASRGFGMESCGPDRG